MPKMPEFKKAVERWGLQKYNRFLGAFGHDMLKHTQLWSCMPSLVGCVRQCTKKAQQKHKDRMERKAERLRRRGETPPEYWKKLPGGKYQGGKDLAKSAEYPQRFATALFKCWQRAQMGA